jgi:hypothetical protein
LTYGGTGAAVFYVNDVPRGDHHGIRRQRRLPQPDARSRYRPISLRWTTFRLDKPPDYVDHVLHRARLKYVKSNDYEPIRAAAGINLLTDEGDSWAGHRATLNHVRAAPSQ